MENVINTLLIQNFKSIRHAVLHPRRVNLIIGPPNVGKSTLLEAMSLLGGLQFEHRRKFMRGFVRYEEPAQLFYDCVLTNPVRIESDSDVCLLGAHGTKPGFHYGVFDQATYHHLRLQLGLPQLDSRLRTRAADDASLLPQLQANPELLHTLPTAGGHYLELDEKGRIQRPVSATDSEAPAPANWFPRPVKAYRFKHNARLDRCFPDASLWPPFGTNLVQVLEQHPSLRREFSELFGRQHQHLRVRHTPSRLEVGKEVNGHSYAYPYSGAGDTLRRFGFHLAAIESSQQAVVLLEEPESHSYPGYITQLAERMVAHENNQFFVTTHSPYFFDSVLENMVPYESRMPELAVFVVDYREFQTRIRQLSDEEVRGLQRDSLDAFNNLHLLAHEGGVRKLV